MHPFPGGQLSCELGAMGTGQSMPVFVLLPEFLHLWRIGPSVVREPGIRAEVKEITDPVPGARLPAGDLFRLLDAYLSRAPSL